MILFPGKFEILTISGADNISKANPSKKKKRAKFIQLYFLLILFMYYIIYIRIKIKKVHKREKYYIYLE